MNPTRGALVAAGTLMCSLVAQGRPITLEEVKAGAASNTEALKAELQRLQAVEDVRISRSSILPHLSAAGAASASASGPQRYFTTVPDPAEPTGFRQQVVDVPAARSNSFQFSLSLTQLLYDGGRWWNELIAAGASREAADGQALEQRWSSRLEASRRFYELLRAQQTLELLQSNERRSVTLLERAKALFDAGKAQKRDVFDAEVNLGNDRIALLRQRQRIESAQIDLAVWIGLPATEALEAVEPRHLANEAEHAPALADVLAMALRRRPLVAVLIERESAAEYAVRSAGGTYWPRLSASASYSRLAPSADPFFTDPSRQNAFSGGLNLQWELFGGLGTNAQVRRAEHARSAAALARASAMRELEGDVRRTHSALNTQLQVVQLSRKNLVLATRALELAEQRFQAGAGSMLDVRDAQVRLAGAEVSVAENRIDVEIAWEALRRVMAEGGIAEGASGT